MRNLKTWEFKGRSIQGTYKEKRRQTVKKQATSDLVPYAGVTPIRFNGSRNSDLSPQALRQVMRSIEEAIEYE
jgi:hypothetical protein